MIKGMIVALMAVGLTGCIQHDYEYHNSARVLEVLDCVGTRYGETCTVKAKLDTGSVIDRPVDTMAYEGQRLYRFCWIEGRTNQTWCKTKLRTRLLDEYKEHESVVRANYEP